jgi:hypothetical protein
MEVVELEEMDVEGVVANEEEVAASGYFEWCMRYLQERH